MTEVGRVADVWSGSKELLERARGVYLGTEPDAWDDLAADLRPAADALLAEIRAAAG